MERKVTMRFPDKTEKTSYVKIRDEEHLNIVRLNPSKVFRDKTKYTRKVKHRRDYI